MSAEPPPRPDPPSADAGPGPTPDLTQDAQPVGHVRVPEHLTIAVAGLGLEWLTVRTAADVEGILARLDSLGAIAECAVADHDCGLALLEVCHHLRDGSRRPRLRSIRLVEAASASKRRRGRREQGPGPGQSPGQGQDPAAPTTGEPDDKKGAVSEMNYLNGPEKKPKAYEPMKKISKP